MVKARSVNSCLVMPSTNTMGRNTHTVVRVDGKMVILKPQFSQVWTAADIQHGQLVVSAVPAVLLLALTNQVLSAMGKPVLPIESTTVEQLVTAGITTVAALISWWKNNSFTAAAVAADSYMARLKQKQ